MQRALFLLTLLAWPGAASGQLGGGTTIPWWLDYYEYTNPDIVSKLDAVGFWIKDNAISCAGGSCTIELPRTEEVRNGASPPPPMCSDVEIFALPRLPIPSTALLVGSNLVLGVHDITDCETRNFVIGSGVRAESAASVFLDPLDEDETLEWTVLEANVYPCKSVIAPFPPTTGWTLIELHDEVTGFTPLKLQRSGFPSTGTPTVIAGYPNKLPLKIEEGALAISNEGVGTTAAHILVASSGSAVFGSSGRVQGVLHSGSLGWWEEDGGCYRPIPGATGTANYTGPVGAELAYIPAIGLDVTHPGEELDNPLLVEHFGPVGGPFSDDDLPFRLAAGIAGDPVDWQQIAALGEPLFDFGGGPTAGHLEPGSSTELTLTSTAITTSLGIGRYTDVVALEDETYETIDYFIHELVVGIESFELERAEECQGPRCILCPLCFLGEIGPSGAQPSESAVYILTSRWSTDQTIEVSGPPWVDLAEPGGASGSLISFTLGAGQSIEVSATIIPDGSHGTVEDMLVFRSTHQAAEMHREETLVRADLDRTIVDTTPNVIVVPGSTTEVLVSSFNSFRPAPAQDVDFCLAANITDPIVFMLVDPPTFSLRSPAGTEIALGAELGSVCWSDELFDPMVPGLKIRELPELANFEGQEVSGPWILVVDAPQTDEWNEVTLETTSARFLIGVGIPQ